MGKSYARSIYPKRHATHDVTSRTLCRGRRTGQENFAAGLQTETPDLPLSFWFYLTTKPHKKSFSDKMHTTKNGQKDHFWLVQPTLMGAGRVHQGNAGIHKYCAFIELKLHWTATHSSLYKEIRLEIFIIIIRYQISGFSMYSVRSLSGYWSSD